MARSFRASSFVFGSTLCAAVVALASSCSDDPVVGDGHATTTSSGGDAASDGTVSTQVTSFAPMGCAYQVTLTKVPSLDTRDPMDLHQDVSSGVPASSNVGDRTASPSWVRRGLGGGVVHGQSGYADPTTSVAIGWQTDAGTLASKMMFGDSATSLTQSQTGFSYVVDQENLPGNGPDAGIRFHEVHVCGLMPGRTYYYKVGGGPAGSEVWSKVYSFTTAPANSASDTVQIGFTGDTRPETLSVTTLPVWTALAQRFSGIPISLFSGDIVYTGVLQDLWDAWLGASDPEAPSTFFALAPGNHDNEDERFFAHAIMPGTAGLNARRYASFDYGPVHLVMLDDYDGIVAAGTDDTMEAAEIKAWLDNDLSAAVANRANVPWIVTFHHHPFYSSTDQTDRATERAAVRAAFQATYDKYHVDLDLCGHDHFYERSAPVLASTPTTMTAGDPTGTTFVIAGAGGATAYGSVPANNPFLVKHVPYDPTMGQGIYGVISASATKLHVDTYMLKTGGKTIADDGAPVDTFDLSPRH